MRKKYRAKPRSGQTDKSTCGMKEEKEGGSGQGRKKGDPRAAGHEPRFIKLRIGLPETGHSRSRKASVLCPILATQPRYATELPLVVSYQSHAETACMSCDEHIQRAYRRAAAL